MDWNSKEHFEAFMSEMTVNGAEKNCPRFVVYSED